MVQTVHVRYECPMRAARLPVLKQASTSDMPPRKRKRDTNLTKQNGLICILLDERGGHKKG
jgi:hypothetical protein